MNFLKRNIQFFLLLDVLSEKEDHRGIVMLEIVVSTFIIGIAAMVSATIIVSAFQGNRVSKNKLIAISLAREGIEAVRNIRDSNCLRYKANRDECWNFLENPETSTPVTVCDTENQDLNRITAGYYKVNIGRYDLPINPADGSPYTYKWYLSKTSDITSITDSSFMIPGDMASYQLA